jgi:hypothetical protein
MDNYKPADNFVGLVMQDVQAYETALKAERVGSLLLSKPAFSILSAGGILLAIFNLLRMASILISPALCL